jgi:hypothetical protein
VVAYYDFISDSTYKYWTSNEPDSTRIYRIKDLDANYFHAVDENHFFVLVTFYATEKIMFTRELPIKVHIGSNLDTAARRIFKIDSVRIYFNQNLGKFLSDIHHGHFQTYDSKKAIPPFIEQELDYLTGGLSLANPNEEFQCCCTSSQTLPERKLDFLAMSKDVFVMTYLTGGIGEEEHILLIKFENNKVVDIWYGVGLEQLHSLKKVVSFLSKRRKDPQTLHPNLDL